MVGGPDVWEVVAVHRSFSDVGQTAGRLDLPPTGTELDQDWHAVWAHLHWLPLGEPELSRALDLLRGLAHTTAGAHRRRPIDYIVAACAESAGTDVVLWHWDRDLTAICEHAGIANEPEHDRAKAHGINLEPGEQRRRWMVDR